MEFVPIEHFEDYYVSPEGIIVNSATGREMLYSPTENGDLTVGLVRNGVQFRRSVKGIVARTFVSGRSAIFDTPILLDGDKSHLGANNIVWRPRWFAWKYSQQFQEPYPDWYYDGPIVEMKSGMRYHTIVEAAMINGLLVKDIWHASQNQDLVFPTAQLFRSIS